MPEPRVPKPNRSACGFHVRDSLCCKLERRTWPEVDSFECDMPAEYQERCGFGKIARALYAYQQKAEPAADTQEPIAGA